MGLGGAKFEHSQRLDVGRAAPFVCGPLSTAAAVRHSVLLPGNEGVLYHTGVEFTEAGEAERELLLELLVHEAERQVQEWEANLQGQTPQRPRKPLRKSEVALRFVCMRYTNHGWIRTITADPNQPVDGITILQTTPDEEVAMLRKSYERGDDDAREFMRQVAMLAILEQMRE